MNLVEHDGRALGDPADAATGRDRLVALFQAHHDDVYRFVLARTGIPATAEDVTSETFVDAARTIAGGADDLSRAWLLTVARRRLIDRWRGDDRQRRRIERLVETSITEPVIDPDGPEERVLAALQSLPSRQRLALTLRYLDERSVAEVASTLETSYSAAESLLSRAREGFTIAYGEVS